VKSRSSNDYREVYSTETGAICAGCKAPKRACKCAEKKKAQVIGSGDVRVQRESKGRGGKTVTVIRGLAMTTAQAEELLKTLKNICGTGGTLKDGVVELQGDRCDAALSELSRRGIKAKRSGG
jgi:translation initiation factor 1